MPSAKTTKSKASQPVAEVELKKGGAKTASGATARASRRAPAPSVSKNSSSSASSRSRSRSPSPAVVKKANKKTAKSKKRPAESGAEVVKAVPLIPPTETKSKRNVSKTLLKPEKVVEGRTSFGKRVVNGYLFLYNLVSALGWAFLLVQLGKSYFSDQPQNYRVLFSKTGMFLAYLQTAAVLEIAHAALGMVKSSAATTAMQIASRLFVTWIATIYAGTGHHWAYGMMVSAWALSDFTRYAYYLTQITKVSVSPLKWARYNLFLILYPVGTLGEAILIFLARIKWAADPLRYYGLFAVLAIYTPGFLYMYSHMLSQRAKHLSHVADKQKSN